MKNALMLALTGALALVTTSCDKDDDNGPGGGGGAPGAVYTLDNATGGNHVLRFTRAANGTLTADGSYSTDGAGTGMGLGSQGAVILDGDRLFAVNAGSNSISVMAVTSGGLTLLSTTPSDGEMPISLTVHGSHLYVLNAGGTANITGFHVANNGQLTPIANSTRELSTAAPEPAQVSFTPNGAALIVTEKATNMISSFPVDNDGMPGTIRTTTSAGMTPFGFSFGHNDLFFVTEAAGGAMDASTVSSYTIDDDANVTVVDGPVATTQTAACWAVTLNNGHTMYCTNTGSGSVSSMGIDNGGQLTLQEAVAANTGKGSDPIDAALSNNSQFLYVLEGLTVSISGYAVGNDGSLTLVDEEMGLPAGSVGLAAK
jgi:6-phosphogluconolactonase